MAVSSAQDVKNMFASIANRYDLGNDILSFGLHRFWAASALRLLQGKAEGACLDVCTGTGALTPGLAKKYKKVVGVDFCPEMISLAEKRSDVNIEFFVGDALNLDFESASFDALTVAYGVRNFTDLEKGLRELNRVLKPNGQLLIIEFGQPRKFVRPFYKFYSQFIMPTLGHLITGNKQAYQYLPKTAATFPCGQKFIDILEQNDFKIDRVKLFSFGICYAYLARRKN